VLCRHKLTDFERRSVGMLLPTTRIQRINLRYESPSGTEGIRDRGSARMIGWMLKHNFGYLLEGREPEPICLQSRQRRRSESDQYCNVCLELNTRLRLFRRFIHSRFARWLRLLARRASAVPTCDGCDGRST
jgi:hypothetical protein